MSNFEIIDPYDEGVPMTDENMAKFGWYKVVRCSDCKHCMSYMAGTYCDYMAHAIEPDGFCAWAERRGE